MSLENEPFLTPQHVMPDEGPDADAYWAVLRSLPNTIRELMASVETADLINNIQKQHRLGSAQRISLAEFMRDLLLGISMPDDVTGYVAERLGIEKSSAIQILKSIESALLTRAGMSIASIGRDTAGPTLQEHDGRVLLKYASLDDLLASIETAGPEDRIRFLEDARQDNRILVLKAMSQLKLGTNSDGKALTYSQLVSQEAPDFSAQDWADALTDDATILEQSAVRDALKTFMANSERLRDLVSSTSSITTARLVHELLAESLAQSKPTVIAHVRFSPYFAGIYDRETVINEQLFEKYFALEPDLRKRLASAELSLEVAKLVQEDVVPEKFAVAVAKTVFLVELGDVSAGSLEELFGKRLDLGDEQGIALAKRIRTSLLSESSPTTEESPLRSVVPTPEPTPQPRAMPSGSSSNVVDLKRQS